MFDFRLEAIASRLEAIASRDKEKGKGRKVYKTVYIKIYFASRLEAVATAYTSVRGFRNSTVLCPRSCKVPGDVLRFGVQGGQGHLIHVVFFQPEARPPYSLFYLYKVPELRAK